MDEPGFPWNQEAKREQDEERIRLQAEIERFEGRKLPGWLVATLVLFVIITVLGVLLWPLMSEAHRWKSGPLGSNGGMTSDTEAVAAIVASRGDVDDSVLTPAQAMVAKQRAMIISQTDIGIVGYSHARGSGFVFDDGLVITAAHVIEYSIPGTITVSCGDQENVPAETIRADHVLDVALLSAPNCHGKRLTLDTEPPRQGEWLAAVGYRYWNAQDDLDDIPDRYREFLPSADEDYTLALPFAHFRRVDLTRVLESKDVSIGPGLSTLVRREGMKARHRIETIMSKNLPRPIAVKGIALPGESGSGLVRPDGAIVGLYVMAFPSFNRAYFMPAAAIRLVLRGYETKG